MADINITTDFTQLNSLKEALSSADTLYVKTVSSVVRENARLKSLLKKAAKDTEETNKIKEQSDAIYTDKLQQATDKREKARAREATRAEKEAQRVVAANEKIAIAEAKLAAEISRNQAASAQRSTAGLNQRLGVTGAAATSAGAGFGALEGELERLRLKYDKIYAASQLYEKSLSELSRAHMLGVTSAKQHESAVEQLNIEYQQFSDSTEGAVLANNRFSQHINQTGAGLNKFGMYAQQVGYQVGDFFVQVQSGTNVLVAFGQQATQLAGLFPGVLGAALGIGISLATAIGAAFMRTSESAKEAASGVLTLSEAQKELNQSTGDYALKLEMLRFGVDTQAEALALKEILDLKVEIQRLTQEYRDTDSLSRRQAIAEEVNALKAQASGQQEIVDKVNESRTAYERTLAINEQMSAVQMGYYASLGKAIKDQKAKTDELKKGMAGVLVEIISSKDAMVAMVATAPSGGWLSGAISDAGTLASKLWDAASAAAAAQNAKPSEDKMKGAYGLYGFTRSNAPSEPVSGDGLGGGGGGGGSGGGGGAGNAAIESLLTSLQTEREVIDEWYAESQTLLQSASDTELQIIGGRNEAKLRLEQEHQEKLKGIRDTGQAGALGDTATFFGHMATLTAGGGDKLAKISRVFAAAEALINTYRAQSQVLADPTLPFLAKFGAVAAIGAAGFGLVNAIKSGSSSSKSSGRGSAAVAAPSSSAPAPQTVFIDSLDPDGLYSGQALINLFDAFYDENDKRGKVFMVAR